jgi:uncharacterized protein (TIGR02271 family)
VVSEPDAPTGADDDQRATAVRHEEELEIGTRSHEAGSVRAQKRIDTDRVEHVEPRAIEYGDVERVPGADGDSGEIETLEDGSISIPLFEERLVVSKQLFVRERVIVRKRTVTEQQRIDAELRKERIVIEREPEGSS